MANLPLWEKCNATCGYVAKVEKTNIAGDDGCGMLWSADTVPIDEILSVKNARAWVSMVSYFKK